MAQVKLTINGAEITEEDSLTILQAVRKHNLGDIPTLCNEERLGHITSCFICVVEVEGARTLVPSCSTKIREGMVVRTDTAKVVEARRTCLELLFSDHYADCVSPCAQECPAGVDIQGYLALVRKGLYREAVELIKDKNPLPVVCGRVCVRKCEVGCRRNILDDPVGINFLKRFAAESDEGFDFRPIKKPVKDKTVAIVGAGPGGLSAAYYLAVEGYRVTVFEAMPEAGGMLRYGIPPYRLPKDLLDREIDGIRELGVEIICEKKLGRDFTVTSLKEQFDAVLLAVGAWGASRMRVENEDAPGVLSGLEVLRKTAGGLLKELKGRVLVVGGGNTAIDASRTAVRLGADETVILYRRTEAQMPAHHEEIEGARQEGVKFRFLVAPTRVVVGESGRVTGLECDRMELGAPDAGGRPRPVVIEGSRHVEPADWIISAIGQSADFKCLEGDGPCSFKLNRWGNMDVNPVTMETGIPGVYSAGDAVTGAATVIEGIAGGRRAAFAIHENLSGEKSVEEKKPLIIRKEMFGPLSEKDLPLHDPSNRVKMPERPAGERIGDFDEVETGISREDTIGETCRCFECGCVEVDTCLLRKYGEKYDALPDHYLGAVNRYRADHRHPFITIDPGKCILCGRCIETCRGILGAPALGFVNRGFKTFVAPAMDKPLAETNCTSCGNCIDSCPTGAITENQPLMARIGDKIKEGTSVCSLCGAGCQINVKSFGRDIRIRSNRDKFTGLGDYLCRKGRFGGSYLGPESRITSPALVQDGKFSDIPWEEAVGRTAEGLNKIRARYGDNSTAVFLSPMLTAEEIFAASVFARKVLRTDLVGSSLMINRYGNIDAVAKMTGAGVSTVSAGDVENAGVILLVNSDPLLTHPVTGWKIRKGVSNGAKLIVINSSRNASCRDAHICIQPKRGMSGAVLRGIAEYLLDMGFYDKDFVISRTRGFEELKRLSEKFSVEEASAMAGISPDQLMEAARILGDPEKKVVAFADPYNTAETSPEDVSSLMALMMITANIGRKGRGIVFTAPGANSAGLLEMGARPGFLAGDSPFTGKDLTDILNSGQIRGALVLGENPMENPLWAESFKKLEFLAVSDLFSTVTALNSSVVLPASSCIESGGTFISMDGRVQTFPALIPPLSGKTNLEFIEELASAMGEPSGFDGVDAVRDAIRSAVPSFRDADFGAEGRLWSGKDGESVHYEEKFFTADSLGDLSPGRFSVELSEREEYPCNSVESYCRDRIESLPELGDIYSIAI